MPFSKTADAAVIHPVFSAENWHNFRQRVASQAPKANGDLPGNLVEQASQMLGQPFDPSSYLLTHATIVASVDAVEVQGKKVGKELEDGFRVNRRFADYRVEPRCDKYINNNQDAWNRPVLLASYPTFTGGHNFVEHVQIEELSKGRIIDACARDIGDSVYVDILIATARQHEELIRAIETMKMATLSMGCTVDGTICTKCGHWAADETEVCNHVKYGKGTPFYDEMGRQHRVAELCGHQSIAPTGGVQFIEASWVETPAFTGAVLRNILEPTPEITSKAKAVMASPPPQWQSDAMMRAATAQRTGLALVGQPWGQPDPAVLGQWDEGEPGGAEEGKEEDGGGASEKPQAPFQGLEDDLTHYLTDRVKKRIQDQMKRDDTEQALNPENPASDADNDTLVKEASLHRAAAVAYRANLDALVRVATSDIDLINRVATLNQQMGMHIPVEVYRAAVRLGSFSNHGSAHEFNRACRDVLGRMPSDVEVKTLVRLGKLVSRWCGGGATNQASAEETP